MLGAGRQAVGAAIGVAGLLLAGPDLVAAAIPLPCAQPELVVEQPLGDPGQDRGERLVRGPLVALVDAEEVTGASGRM